MYTHGIEVLDRTHNHAVVGMVTHDLEFEFFPALDRFFDQDLRNGARFEAVAGHELEFFHGVGEACALAAKDVRRADNNWQSNRLDSFSGLGHTRFELFLFGVAGASG